MIPRDRARVLITVKAAPEPSEKYGDTVCVAGIRLDGPSPTWIRLYPVPFRWMTSRQQFHKYEVIEVDLLPSVNDRRPESHRIDVDSVVRLHHVESLSARGSILDPLIGPTMCQIREGVVADLNARSLALVEVREVRDLIVVAGRGWTPAQQAKIDRAVQQEALFGVTPPELQAPRFEAKYHYFCMDADCRGHRQGILDWELTAFQRRLSRDDEKAAASIRKRFLDELCAPSKRVHFYVGNIADPTKRRNFSVLGVYGPPRLSDFRSTLF